MAAFIIGGLVVLVGLAILARWFVSADPKTILKVMRIAALILAALVALYLVLARRWQLLPLLFLFLMPWLNRLSVFRNMAKNASGPTPGNRSDVKTDFLIMQLDHDSGTMAGKVKRGHFAGRQVGDLTMAELIALRGECVGVDPPSVAILDAYLDRQYGDEWRSAGGAQGTAGGSRDGGMSADEAYEVLGLPAGADRDDIERAYRQMMQKLHPDHGGSDYLAAKINQAKNILLGD